LTYGLILVGQSDGFSARIRLAIAAAPRECPETANAFVFLIKALDRVSFSDCEIVEHSPKDHIMTPIIKASSLVSCLIAICCNAAAYSQIQGAGSPSSSNLEALSPQPLPPKTSQVLRPNSGINALNPQPLPPNELPSVKRNNDLTALNPQPLPPKDRPALAIKSMREVANLAPDTLVKVNGRELTVKALREQIVVSQTKPEVSGNTLFKFSSGDLMSPVNRKPMLNDAAADIRDQLDRYAGGSQGRTGGGKPTQPPPPAPWVKHDLPKSRWKLVSCADTSEERAVVNHCAGNDLAGAQANARCVASGLEMRVNGIGIISTNFCSYNGGDRAGGFHTKYNASNFEKKSGVDVYEMQINPARRWEHGWSAPYSTVKVDSMVPQQGTVRAIARWTTDRCISAKATFFGATVDEDYACIASYYNSVTKAECPAGVAP
jgi:hypothetical protein